MTHNIKIKKMGITEMFDYKTLEQNPKIIEIEKEGMLKKFIFDITNHKLLLIDEPEYRKNEFYFTSHCTLEGCKFKDIELCSEKHPKFIKSGGPFYQHGYFASTISKKWSKYLEKIKESYAKQHFSKVVIQEVSK